MEIAADAVRPCADATQLYHTGAIAAEPTAMLSGLGSRE